METLPKSSSAPANQATLLIADAKYTAPELIMANRTPDQAAHTTGDIYVLGFMFYELLAGNLEMQSQFADAERMQTGLAWLRWHADSKVGCARCPRPPRPVPKVWPTWWDGWWKKIPPSAWVLSKRSRQR